MKTHGTAEVQRRAFLTSALVEFSGQLQTPAVLSPEIAPGTYGIGSWKLLLPLYGNWHVMIRQS
jgi:hypothetical protein